jgi:hypothetical protein
MAPLRKLSQSTQPGGQEVRLDARSVTSLRHEAEAFFMSGCFGHAILKWRVPIWESRSKAVIALPIISGI